MNISIYANGAFLDYGYMNRYAFKNVQSRDSHAVFAKLNHMLAANSVIRDITMPILRNLCDCFECLSPGKYKAA
jgi:hypothetical protein